MPWVNPTSPATGDLITASQGAIIATDLSMLGGSWTAYTPVVTAATTNPTMGTTPTQLGSYMQFGKTIMGQARIQFGTGMTAGSGVYSLSIPVNALTPLAVVGSGFAYTSASGLWSLVARINSTANGIYFVVTAPVNYTVTNAVPFTWVAGAQLAATFTYETV